MLRKKINLLIVAMLLTSVVFFNGCDAVADAVEGALKVELKDATDITFISDYIDDLSNLDQASIPWVFGSLLFTKDIQGIKVPVLFDADDDSQIKVDLKIDTASSTRSPVKVFEGEVTLKAFSVASLLPENIAEYAVVPDSSPLFAGKTIVPQTFLVTLPEYDWLGAGSNAKDDFVDAIKAHDFSAVSNALDNVPVPLNCETVRIQVDYNNGQAKGEKYLLADPKAVLKLLEEGSAALDPILAAQNVGFSASDVSDFLTNMIGTESCSGEPDKTLYQ